MKEIKIQGYGGQGAVTLATLLAQAVTDSGHYSQALPFFGMERRGAPVRAVVRISEEPIRVHSQACAAELVLVLSENLIDTALSSDCLPSADVVVNAQAPLALPGRNVITLDAAGIALDAGLGTAAAAVNVPMYAAACRVLGIDRAVMRAVLEAKWSGSVGEKNIAAAERAFDAAE